MKVLIVANDNKSGDFTFYDCMQWTDRIRQVKIILVAAAVVIAVASLLISHFLVRDLSEEERHRMEVWAQALHALNAADETTDLTLVLNVIEGNNTIPVIVLNDEGGVDDYRNIEDTLNIQAYAQQMLKPGGNFCVKIFQNGDQQKLLMKMRETFTQAKGFKPEACRAESFETYLIGLNKKG